MKKTIMTEIAGYGRLLHEKDLVIGTGGNISARTGKTLVIKKQGTDMSLGKTGAYLSLPYSRIDEYKGQVSTEWPFHVACYEARPDIGAVIHVHSPYVVAIAERVNFLSEEISYEFEYIMEKPVPVIPYIEPGSGDLAMAISKEISYGINGVIMRRHGSVVVGRTLREAYVRTLALERAAKTVLLANPGV